MSLRAIPLMALVFILYNVIVMFLGDASTVSARLRDPLFGFTMLYENVRWEFSWGDLILLVTLLVLFVEILKATYTSTAALIDHGLSMAVFVAFLIEFLLVPRAGTSVFFLAMIAALIDVIAGYTIGIRVARRDVQFGQTD